MKTIVPPGKFFDQVRTIRPVIIIIGLYLLLTIAFTWPLVLQFNTAVYANAGDPQVTLWELWAGNPVWTNGKTLSDLVGLPFGVQTNLFNAPHFPLYFSIVKIPGLFPSPVFAHNFFVVTSFLWSALVAYAFALKITRSHEASFIAGLVYSFGPYHQIHSHSFFSFDPQWIALFILALWWFDELPSWRRAILAGAAYGITVTANPYYGFYGAVAGITLVIVRIFQQGLASFVSRERITGYLLIAVISGLFALLFYRSILIGLADEQQDKPNASFSLQNYQRNSTWPFYLSARPWDYLLPATTHPVFGEWASDLRSRIATINRGDWRGGDNDPGLDIYWFWNSYSGLGQTLYIGYMALLFASIAMWQRWRTRKSDSTLARHLTTFVFVLGLVGLWWSAPPWLPIGSLFAKWLPEWAHNWIIPFPIWFTFNIMPFFRAPSRIAVLVILCVGVLAAVGLAVVIAKLSSRWAKIASVAICSVLMLFEYISPQSLLPIYPAPEVYQWLAQQPEAPLISFPANNLQDMLYQSVHHKPIVGNDGTLIDYSPINRLQQYVLTDPSLPDTVEKLSALEVQYVLWHTNSSQTSLSATPGLTLLQTFDDTQIFEVNADPAEMIVLATPNQDVWLSHSDWQWKATRKDLWIWNPTQVSVSLNIIFKTDTIPDLSNLVANLNLTPHPETLIVSGIRQNNPLAGLKYPDRLYQAIYIDDGSSLLLNAIDILPGETKLTLSWSGMPSRIHGVAVTINSEP